MDFDKLPEVKLRELAYDREDPRAQHFLAMNRLAASRSTGREEAVLLLKKAARQFPPAQEALEKTRREDEVAAVLEQERQRESKRKGKKAVQIQIGMIVLGVIIMFAASPILGIIVILLAVILTPWLDE